MVQNSRYALFQALVIGIVFLVVFSLPVGASIAVGVPGKADSETVDNSFTGVSDTVQQADGEPTIGPEVQNLTSQSDETVTLLVGLEQTQTSTAMGTKENIDHLKSHAEQTQEPVIQELTKLERTTVHRSFWLTNTIVVETRASAVGAIADVPRVDSIHLNRNVSLPEPVKNEPADPQSNTEYTYGLQQINAPETYDQFENRGEGIKVAVIDTGVDPEHPDIDIKSQNFAEFNSDGTAVSDPVVRDTGIHGTHVSGTVVGSDSSGTQIGVAPEATLMHAVGLPDGSGSTAQIIASMEWAVENGADIISMSLGGPVGPDYIDAIENADDAGVVVIAASGNDGPQTSGSPASEWTAFSVGATDETGQVAEFSSGQEIFAANAYGQEAPEQYPERYIVPDHVAPGASVVSASPTDQNPVNPYRKLSGTSMATPHVSGALAVALSNTDREFSRNELYNLLTATARKPPEAPEPQDIRYGHGIIDLEAFTEAVVNDTLNTVTGTVVAKSTGDPLPGSTVRIVETGEQVTVKPDGSYHLPTLATGTVTLAVNAYPAKTNRSITISQSDETTADFEIDTAQTAFLVDRPWPGSISPKIVGGWSSIAAEFYAWGNVEATKTVELYVDGERQDQRELTLSAEGSETVYFDYTPKPAHRPVANIEVRSPDDSYTREIIISEAFAGGNGTAANPFLIDGVEQFYALGAGNVDREPSESYYKLIDNVNMSGIDWAEPILAFGGTLDGNGYTIKNVDLSQSSVTPGGLIRNLNGDGKLKNIHVENATIAGGSQTGGLVGLVWGEATITNTTFNGSVTGGGVRVGGLVGTNWGTIKQSSAHANVTAVSAVGGLAGDNKNGAQISRSFANGTVTGSDGVVGGLVGFNSNSEITDSYAHTSVTTQNITGGLVGENRGGTIERTYATGNVTSPEMSGGLIGLDQEGDIDNSYWDTEKTTQEQSDGGTGVQSTDMTGETATETMTGFDFGGTWMTTEQYPVLRWETEHSDSQGVLEVSIVDSNSPVVENETLSFDVSVSNTGTERQSQVVELKVGSLGHDSKLVSLDGGESKTITLSVQTSHGDAGEYEVMVESADSTDSMTAAIKAQTPPNFQVTVVETNGPVPAGKTVSIDTKIKNTGDLGGTQTVELVVDGIGEDIASVSLDSGESVTRTLSVQTKGADAGTYTATISSENNSETVDLEVLQPASFGIEIVETNAPIVETETFNITVSVANNGQTTGTTPVALVVGETERAARNVTVASGNATLVNLTWPTGEEDNGTYPTTIITEDETAQTVLKVVENESALGPPSITANKSPQDLNGDGLYRDLDGDGTLSIADVQLLLEHREENVVQHYTRFFDYNDDGVVSLADVRVLFQSLSG
jgi:subtilisin family serine protease